jgi:hypothetical protein
MKLFVRRLATVIAVAFVSMAVAVIVTPAVSSADCAPNMSSNPATKLCKQPPPPPEWYTPPPAYAPAFAPLGVPPPPPTPSWAPSDPVWSNGFQRWGIVLGTLWVPI